MNIAAGGLGQAAVERARRTDDGFRYVRLPELIALKLYAGGRRSERDVEELLAVNPDADLDDIRKVCAEFGLSEALESVIDPRP